MSRSINEARTLARSGYRASQAIVRAYDAAIEHAPNAPGDVSVTIKVKSPPRGSNALAVPRHLLRRFVGHLLLDDTVDEVIIGGTPLLPEAE